MVAIKNGEISIVCEKYTDGSLSVSIYSPWTYLDDLFNSDVLIHDIDGKLGMACTGQGDYYCSTKPSEAEVFIWEIQTGCLLYRNWIEFRADPERFLSGISCPHPYPVKVYQIP
jgi:hypothetical protein